MDSRRFHADEIASCAVNCEENFFLSLFFFLFFLEFSTQSVRRLCVYICLAFEEYVHLYIAVIDKRFYSKLNFVRLLLDFTHLVLHKFRRAS